MKKLTAAWLWFWCGHIQKTLALVAGAAAGIDLVGYHDSIAAFTGERGYHALRLGIAGLIFWRAMAATRSKDDSGPGNSPRP